MNLLDTHALVWAVNAPERLSPAARQVIEEGAVAVSAASLWEMLLKKGSKNEIVPDPLKWWEKHVVRRGIKILDLEWRHIAHLDTLPLLHKDPFDRILMSQSITEGWRLVTQDQIIRDHYQGAVRCFW